MGAYVNPGSSVFQMALRSRIFVDKTGFIEVTNRYINTLQRYMCISRPRRFGKSMAADMLTAYYGGGEDASPLFDSLAVSRTQDYKKHLNQYDVVKINMQEFLSAARSAGEMLDMLQARVIADLKRAYPEYVEGRYLPFVMQDIFAYTRRPFVILIDEWDCLFREYKQDREAQKQYLDFLRAWLKDQNYVALAYMTGILPIKKYGSHSALNMFTEYSMTNPRETARFFGFTEEEVRELCEKYGRSFEEAAAWYDGYEMAVVEGNERKIYSMYSPKSIVDAMLSGVFDNYWNQTETYEALKVYIRMNFDGLKDSVVRMLAGDRITINTGTFSNDMTTFQGRDDVLTLLVHLGYLSYRLWDHTVGIPNKEVSREYVNAISTMDWQEVIRSLEDSRKLLEALWAMDGKAVAEGIDRAHREISILQYNDENSLSCTINLAFYFAREYYTIVREMPGGKGFADVCFIPRRLYGDKPAAVIELKWNESAEGAIAQIKERRYVEALKDYRGNLLLAGINYDKKTKTHSCVIERVENFITPQPCADIGPRL